MNYACNSINYPGTDLVRWIAAFITCVDELICEFRNFVTTLITQLKTYTYDAIFPAQPRPRLSALWIYNYAYDATLEIFPETQLQPQIDIHKYTYDASDQNSNCKNPGLVYYNYRYYSPELGRWTSRDPVGVMGGANIYMFVANCPLCFIDPHGLAACSWAVGLCSRNVAGVDVPRSVTIRGRRFTIPNWVRNAVNRVVPDHHDVRVESYSSSDCTGAAEGTLTRGFFADSFNDAISHYAVSLILFTGKDGWVSGHVGNSSDPGPCSMTCVAKDRYDTVKQRISSSTASRYHLTRYNCQTWAAEQLR